MKGGTTMAVVGLAIAGMIGCSPSGSSPEAMSTQPHAQANDANRPAPQAEALPPNANFYEAPEPLPDGPPGTLLRYQEIQPPLRAGAHSYRIMYLSESVAGARIVVTGAAIVPDAPPPPAGRNLLTIAHGTTGLADDCAPSKDLPPSRPFPPNELALLANAPMLSEWLMVQTDYEGLGTPGLHPYLVGPSEGRSVIDAARAASALPSAEPSGTIAIAGYSQGGHAALWAGEVARSWAPELRVVGVFSGAPGADLDWALRTTPETQQLPTRRAIVLATIAGHHAAYPDADPASVLSAVALDRLGLLDEQCVAEMVLSLADLDPAEMLRPDGIESWAALLGRSNAGRARIGAPILVIWGDQDDSFPGPAREAMIDRMCAVQGQIIERRIIPGTHNTASVPAYAAGIDWLMNLAAGRQPLNQCPARQVRSTQGAPKSPNGG